MLLICQLVEGFDKSFKFMVCDLSLCSNYLTHFLFGKKLNNLFILRYADLPHEPLQCAGMYKACVRI